MQRRGGFVPFLFYKNEDIFRYGYSNIFVALAGGKMFQKYCKCEKNVIE